MLKIWPEFMRHTMGGIQLWVPPRDSFFRLTLAIWENGGSFSCLIVAYDEAEKEKENRKENRKN